MVTIPAFLSQFFIGPMGKVVNPYRERGGQLIGKGVANPYRESGGQPL